MIYVAKFVLKINLNVENLFNEKNLKSQKFN